MAEGKYGRLFTGLDLERAIGEAYRRGRDGQLGAPMRDRADFAEEVLGSIETTFPADEPLFLLRGQDLAAPEAIGTGSIDYASSAMLHGASDEFVTAVVHRAQAMLEWQRANPDRVGVPD